MGDSDSVLPPTSEMFEDSNSSFPAPDSNQASSHDSNDAVAENRISRSYVTLPTDLCGYSKNILNAIFKVF